MEEKYIIRVNTIDEICLSESPGLMSLNCPKIYILKKSIYILVMISVIIQINNFQ